ncbi:MAG TPA: hypothetical protein VFO34_00755, partial [Candidatus Acidoferrales bacterium]|nr:hypothetical protein [Candidatus Acidoferrales bacterium]
REAESAVESISAAQKSAGFEALLKAALQKLSGSASKSQSAAPQSDRGPATNRAPERKLRAAR